jgi:glycosyltransferase involved in cell wall biosynthesis
MVAAVPWARHQLLVGELLPGDHVRLPVDRDQVEIEPSLRRSISPWHDAVALHRLTGRLRRGRYALLVTHQSKAGALGRTAAGRAAIPVIHSLSMASFGAGYGRVSSAVFRRVERLLVSRTSAYAVVGHDLSRQYEALGIDAGKLHVVRSGARLPAPPADRAAARAALAQTAGYEEGRTVLAYVGSLEARKNPLMLLDLLAQTRALLPDRDPVLVVAGDGPERGALETAIQAQGLDAHVKLLGHVTDPAVVFGSAAVVVLLSQVEGLPQVLLQAAACEVPFVAFDVSGVREMFDLGATGRAVPIGDVAGAAEAVAALLADEASAPRAISLDEWRPEVISARYSELFASVIPGGYDAEAGRPAAVPSGTR